MGVKSITFPTSFKSYNPEDYPEGILEEDDIENSNIDVFVQLDDGSKYVIEVATAKNIEYQMDLEQMNYFDGHPVIIVKQLTREIIKEAITAYAEKNDGYWLKLHHFASYIDPIVFKKLQDEHKEEDDEELDNS